jgi:hypothetical protein
VISYTVCDWFLVGVPIRPIKKITFFHIEKLLNPISSHVFDQLVWIGKLITDFQEVGEAVNGSAGDGL